MSDTFHGDDFAHTASLLRCGEEGVIKATLSNNFNIILAALDIATKSAFEAAAARATACHCCLVRFHLEDALYECDDNIFCWSCADDITQHEPHPPVTMIRGQCR